MEIFRSIKIIALLVGAVLYASTANACPGFSSYSFILHPVKPVNIDDMNFVADVEFIGPASREISRRQTLEYKILESETHGNLVGNTIVVSHAGNTCGPFQILEQGVLIGRVDEDFSTTLQLVVIPKAWPIREHIRREDDKIIVEFPSPN